MPGRRVVLGVGGGIAAYKAALLLRRFTERTAAAAEPAHADAGWLMSQVGGDAAFMSMYDRLLLILSSRTGAVVIPCPEGAEDTAYAELTWQLETSRP